MQEPGSQCLGNMVYLRSSVIKIRVDMNPSRDRENDIQTRNEHRMSYPLAVRCSELTDLCGFFQCLEARYCEIDKCRKTVPREESSPIKSDCQIWSNRIHPREFYEYLR